MAAWYRRSIRNKLYLGMSLLIVCVIEAVLVFSLLSFQAINVTNSLISGQRSIVDYDFVLGELSQSLTRFIYGGRREEWETFTARARVLNETSESLYEIYPTAYIRSLRNATRLATGLGQTLFEAGDAPLQPDALLTYEWFQAVNRTVDYLLPYAQQDVAAAVSQRILQLGREQRTVTLYCTLAVGTQVLISLIVTSRVIGRIVASLRFITGVALKVESEPSALNAPPSFSADELGILTRAMYHMSDTICAQMHEIQAKAELENQLQQKAREVLESHLQVSNLRLKLLQDQVKPHFLFNCLNIIQKLAFIESAPRCQKATDLIVRYLRGVLDQGTDISTLDAEFDHLEDYFRIQEMRFGSRFSFELFCDEDCRAVLLPAMTLQPLVENAFIHGIGKCARKGWIHCRATRVGEHILLSISDNGAGLSAERIEQVYAAIHSADIEKADAMCIGLIGTAKRLRFFFGPTLSLQIESEPDVKTTITFRIPNAFSTADHA